MGQSMCGRVDRREGDGRGMWLSVTVSLPIARALPRFEARYGRKIDHFLLRPPNVIFSGTSNFDSVSSETGHEQLV